MATPTTSDPSDRKTRQGKFVWFEHESADAKRAQAFYGEVLGWRTHAWGDSGYDMILAGDTLDTMIGGYAALKSAQQPSQWVSYISVEDVDATAKAAAANGGKVIEQPHDLPGVGRAARIADPQGAVLCLFNSAAGDPADATASAPPPLGRFFWSELHTTDPASALSFYEKVLGFTHETMDMGPGGAYHVLSHGGVGRGGVTGHLMGAEPHWLPYVAVDDPDATTARAKRFGATILVEPQDIPGIGRFTVLKDPTGAVLAVMKALPQNAHEEA